MSQETEYREHASQCLRLAQSAVGELERIHWLDMAERWLKWADLERKKDRALGRPGTKSG